ncbi:MAG TPA: Uma2 family endonuclease [Pyrinomonadaceae bacterium]|jgi:Uma2 family endonuclease
MSETILEERRAITSAGFVIHWPPPLTMTDEQFFLLARHNRDLRLERTAEGDLIVMPPTGGATGNRNMEINRQFGNWARTDGTGAAFDSSTGFKLPNGAERSPDAAWVRHERLAALTREQKEKFIPLCPDFALELRSPSDDLADVQAKLEEYIANGAQLGWLVDPQERRVHVYRPGAPPEILEHVESVAGAPVLPGFTLDLKEIWEPNV